MRRTEALEAVARAARTEHTEPCGRGYYPCDCALCDAMIDLDNAEPDDAAEAREAHAAGFREGVEAADTATDAAWSKLIGVAAELVGIIAPQHFQRTGGQVRLADWYESRLADAAYTLRITADSMRDKIRALLAREDEAPSPPARCPTCGWNLKGAAWKEACRPKRTRDYPLTTVCDDPWHDEEDA